MIELKVDITGIERVLTNLERITDETIKSADDGIQASGRFVAQGAKQLAPIDTGKLRDSIISEKVKDRVAKVAATASYAVYQEFGFHHWKSGKWIPGKHFMETALFSLLMQIRDQIGYSIERIVR